MHIVFSLDTVLNSSYVAVGENFRPKIAAFSASAARPMKKNLANEDPLRRILGVVVLPGATHFRGTTHLKNIR